MPESHKSGLAMVDWDCDCRADHTAECEAEFERNQAEWLSLAWEAATGADSIPTIERIYQHTPGGAHVCVYPDCSFARRDSHLLWRHVHTAHGDPSLPPEDFDPGPWL